MAVNIVVPSMGFGKGLSTKDLIISNLIDEWPLTAKQLFNRISKQAESKVTYQAVHKMLIQLRSEDIIVKIGTKYQLSKDWIEKIKKFGERLSASYSDEKKIPVNYSFDKPLFLTFNSISEIGRFIIFDFHGAFSNPPKEISLCLWNHAWPVISVSDIEYAFLVGLFKCGKYYSLTRSNTPLDKFFTEIVEKAGKHCRINVPYSAQQDTFVHDDIICQVFFPPTLSKQMEKIYSSTKKIDAERLHILFKDFVSKEVRINVIIFKNPELATKLKEEILQIFSKPKKVN